MRVEINHLVSVSESKIANYLERFDLRSENLSSN